MSNSLDLRLQKLVYKHRKTILPLAIIALGGTYLKACQDSSNLLQDFRIKADTNRDGRLDDSEIISAYQELGRPIPIDLYTMRDYVNLKDSD